MNFTECFLAWYATTIDIKDSPVCFLITCIHSDDSNDKRLIMINTNEVLSSLQIFVVELHTIED